MEYTHIDTPLGQMRVVAQDGALCGLYFVPQKALPAIQPTWIHDHEHPLFLELHQALNEYFHKCRTRFDMPYHLLGGTPLQQDTWKALQKIPYGTVTTYKEIAQQIGRVDAVRAVANAVGCNPLSIIIPCHRVIGSDGRLHGYAGGVERKQALLLLEKGKSWTLDKI